MGSKHQKYIEFNRKAWDRYTGVHVDSDFYDNQAFLSGRSSLNSTEIEELGDINGKSILHLQCHFGQDTLSLERLGATATGIDLSGESIDQAQKIADRLNLKSRFIQSDIYQLDKVLQEKFDLVFTSYGVLFWLPDLWKWADIINSFLDPDGRFYIIEFHPFLDLMDEDFGSLKYPYFNTNEDPLAFTEKGTYADMNADLETTTYGWPHSLGEVVSALSGSGLQIEYLHEFPFCHYNIYPDMIEFSPKKFYHRELKGSIPYMFSILARKK